MSDFNFDDTEDDTPDWLRIDSLLDPILENVYQQGIKGAFMRIALAVARLTEKPGLVPADETEPVAILTRLLECAKSFPQEINETPAPKLGDGFECEEDAWTHVEDRLLALGWGTETLAEGFKAVAELLEMLSAGRPDETPPGRAMTP